MSSSYIEISRKALAKNIRFLKQIVGKDTVISSVIKGNAYGHGIGVFAPLVEACGVRHFSVFSIDEAATAYRFLSKDSHVMIMGHIDDCELEWAIARGVSFYIFDVGRLEASVAAAKKLGIPARIHLELETGLNRTGLEGQDLDRAVDVVKANRDCLQVDGVCTHYAGAESIANYWRIKRQIETFTEVCSTLERTGIRSSVKHTACSAAALRYPETAMDMVRFGIAQYGYWPSRETRMQYFLGCEEKERPIGRDPLRRVLTWKSRIMDVKRVGPGQYVGYGNLCLTSRAQKIATVPVGYFHGFARALSNLGYVLVHGRRAAVLGFVSMNIITIDITHLGDVERGDEVVILGKQGRNEITVSSFSEMSRNLNYEALVHIAPEIPRVAVD